MPDSFKIFETEQYLRDLRKLKIGEKSSLYKKISQNIYAQLKENPFYGRNIKKLKDWKPETWRYRIGRFRMFYTIDKDEGIIFIIAIDPRDKAY